MDIFPGLNGHAEDGDGDGDGDSEIEVSMSQLLPAKKKRKRDSSTLDEDARLVALTAQRAAASADVRHLRDVRCGPV